LSEIVIRRKTGKEKDGEKIFFNPKGMSIYELFEGYRVFQPAKEKGVTLFDKIGINFYISKGNKIKNYG